MKNLKFIVGSLVLFFTVVSASAFPKFHVEGGDTKDWGDIRKSDNPLKHTFLIKNKGDDTLRIYRVKPTCGCTTAPISRDQIEPGGTATLDVTYRVSQPGKNSKSIQISTNDPEQRHTELNLKANLILSLSAFPTYFGFGTNLQVGKEEPASLELTNTTNNDIIIKKVKHEISGLSLNIKKGSIIPPKGKLKVNATLKPEAVGRINGVILLYTSDHEVDRLSIRIWGEVKK